MKEIQFGTPIIIIDPTYFMPSLIVGYECELDGMSFNVDVYYNVTHLQIQEGNPLADNPDDYYGYEEIEYEFVGMVVAEDEMDDIHSVITQEEVQDQVFMQIDEDLPRLDEAFLKALKA